MARICMNLIFEDGAEEAIRTLWSEVANAGIPVRGLTGYRPHVTLAGQLTPSQVLQGLEACLRTWKPISGSAIGIGMRVYPDITDYYSISF